MSHLIIEKQKTGYTIRHFQSLVASSTHCKTKRALMKKIVAIIFKPKKEKRKAA